VDMYQPTLKKKRNGMPILRNSEIDDHAEKYLKDYNSSVLKIPQPVNIEEFAELYLDLTMDYVYLSHCGFILGRMIFQEVERVPVYLPEENCADYLYARRGTLLIDNTVLEDRKEYRLRSTIGHECGHWLFHSDFCLNVNDRNPHGNLSVSEIAGCKKTDIEGGVVQAGRRRLVTDMDWLEHHAKYFSAAILMPKTPFITTVLDLRDNTQQNNAALIESLSGIFQVSPSSVNIRLEQLGLKEYVSKSVKVQGDKPYQLFTQIPGTL
jgi:Zn-dependent peptidase ImmA (M78 family)